MSDLEITKACAEAMGIASIVTLSTSHISIEIGDGSYTNPRRKNDKYDPLHDDAQAMALVKKFALSIDRACVNKSTEPKQWGWRVMACNVGHHRDTDLNRAICECVAKMRVKK